jgi:hypothetical protein
MTDPNFVTVRRPSDAPFSVMPADLICEPPEGYDLALMRDLAINGLDTPITVRPVANGLFRVVDGRKRLAAVRMLIRINKMVYDKVRGFARPATKVFALLRCRIRSRPARAKGATEDRSPGAVAATPIPQRTIGNK